MADGLPGTSAVVTDTALWEARVSDLERRLVAAIENQEKTWQSCRSPCLANAAGDDISKRLAALKVRGCSGMGPGAPEPRSSPRDVQAVAPAHLPRDPVRSATYRPFAEDDCSHTVAPSGSAPAVASLSNGLPTPAPSIAASMPKFTSMRRSCANGLGSSSAQSSADASEPVVLAPKLPSRVSLEFSEVGRFPLAPSGTRHVVRDGILETRIGSSVQRLSLDDIQDIGYRNECLYGTLTIQCHTATSLVARVAVTEGPQIQKALKHEVAKRTLAHEQ